MDGSLTSRLKTARNTMVGQVPVLPYVGFSLWMAWNIIAFNGFIWLEENTTSWRVAELVNMHLASSIATLVLFAVFARRLNALVGRTGFAVTGGMLACIGTAFVLVTRPSMVPSLYLFVVGCVLTGLGTTCLFVRSVIFIAALTPRKAFGYLCKTLVIANIVFLFIYHTPRNVGLACFLLLPLASALLSCIRPFSQTEGTLLTTAPPLTKQYAAFAGAILVYSTTVQVLNNSLFPLPLEQSQQSSFYSLVLSTAVFLICYLLGASSKRPDNAKQLYTSIALAIILLLFVMAFNVLGPIAAGSLSSAANNVLNLIVWTMLAHIVCQAQGNAIRVLCVGNASTAGGTVLGNAIASAFGTINMTDSNFMAMCLALTIVSVIVVLFLFPERKVGELLIPVPEEPVEDDRVEHRAPWKEACEAIAAEHALTEREAEIFSLLARGRSTQQVSDMLVVSPFTVRSHVRHIYVKLDVHSRDELADFVAEYVREHPSA